MTDADSLDDLVDVVLIHFSTEFVREDSDALMLPQSYQPFFTLQDFRRTGENSLKDAGEISHVEDVVEAARGRQKILLDVQPELNRSLRQLRRQIQHLPRKKPRRTGQEREEESKEK